MENDDEKPEETTAEHDAGVPDAPTAPMIDEDPVAPGAESEAVDAVMAAETVDDDAAAASIPADIADGTATNDAPQSDVEPETPEPLAQADGAETPGAQADGAESVATEAVAQADGAETAVNETASGAAATEDPETEADVELPILPPQEVRAIVEALIFTSPQPITPRELNQVLNGVTRESWEAAIAELRAEYSRDGRGLQLVEVAGGWQITTRPEYNDWLRELLDPRAPNKLSIQALETLAVIAYKQPVTMPEIIELRGVKSGGVIKTLLERRLIRITGRKEVVGRPMLYGTTKDFLLTFGLKSLAELPKIEEFADVLGEEVDVAGLKRAIETPAPVEVPLTEDEVTPPADAAADEPAGEPGGQGPSDS